MNIICIAGSSRRRTSRRRRDNGKWLDIVLPNRQSRQCDVVRRRNVGVQLPLQRLSEETAETAVHGAPFTWHDLAFAANATVVGAEHTRRRQRRIALVDGDAVIATAVVIPASREHLTTLFRREERDPPRGTRAASLPRAATAGVRLRIAVSARRNCRLQRILIVVETLPSPPRVLLSSPLSLSFSQSLSLSTYQSKFLFLLPFLFSFLFCFEEYKVEFNMWIAGRSGRLDIKSPELFNPN